MAKHEVALAAGQKKVELATYKKCFSRPRGFKHSFNKKWKY